LADFLRLADYDKLRQLFVDALFEDPPRVIVGRETEPFATEFNLAFDALPNVASRLLIQDTCVAVLQAAPWRYAREHGRGLVELLAIARHTCSVSASRFLFELVQREIQQDYFNAVWIVAGDLIVTTIIEPIHLVGTQDYARKLFFDVRFEDCALITFFRLAEVQPKACLELLPRFLDILAKIEKTRPQELPHIWTRFAGTFDPSDVAFFLDELDAVTAVKLADRVIVKAYSVEEQAEDPYIFEAYIDDPTPSVAYYISRPGKRPQPLNPVPFIKRALQNKRRYPNTSFTLQDVLNDYPPVLH
jgi:hypothetical protein